MQADIRLLPENIVSYARHEIAEIDLSDLDELGRDWHNAVLDVRGLNAVARPFTFWKRGTLHPSFIQRPRIYIASYKIGTERIHSSARDIDTSKRLEGFQLITQGISWKEGFWDVKPLYGGQNAL